MSTTTAATAFDQAEGRASTNAARADYERLSLLLARKGRLVGVELEHLDFRVLQFLLGQKPGFYAAHHDTIAKAIESNKTSVKSSFKRLRTAGLVLSELIRPHHALPSGRYTRTNVNRYWVNVPRLASLLDAPANGPKSTPSIGPNSAPSYGTVKSMEQPPPLPPTPTPTDPSASRVTSTLEGQAVSPISRIEKRLTVQASSELGQICNAWNALDLGRCGDREICALEKRLDEGATIEQLEAAVAGAGAERWLRRAARVPFAVVFASIASIERRAHEGRKILDAHARTTREVAENARRDREWRAEQRARANAPAAMPPPPANELLAELPPLAETRPLSREEFAQRRAQEQARLEAWMRESGEDVS
jgi:hypothetical protein